MPKGANAANQFNRSILILTPQRALKFTATTLERHFVWLTALSFLSHSSMAMENLSVLPPVPQADFVAAPSVPSLRRNPIRDSIKVAKGKARPMPRASRSFTAHPVPELPSNEEDEMNSLAEAASPPTVPRFSSHARKRSNTAPRHPPTSFRSFTSHNVAPSSYSATTGGSSDLYSPSSAGVPGAPSIPSGRSSVSRRTSEASGPSSVGMTNFFDAVGTVRMEAFIDRTERDLHSDRYGGGHKSRHGTRRKESNYWGNSPDIDLRSEGSSEIYFHTEDPFRGF